MVTRSLPPDPGEPLGPHPAGGLIIYLPKTRAVVHEHPLAAGQREARRDIIVHFACADERFCRRLALYVPFLLTSLRTLQ